MSDLAAGGLFNQHLTLLSFLTLGIVSGADELLLVHSERRKASTDDQTWDRQPFDTLWDVPQLQAYLQGPRGTHQGLMEACTAYSCMPPA